MLFPVAAHQKRLRRVRQPPKVTYKYLDPASQKTWDSFPRCAGCLSEGENSSSGTPREPVKYAHLANQPGRRNQLTASITREAFIFFWRGGCVHFGKSAAPPSAGLAGFPLSNSPQAETLFCASWISAPTGASSGPPPHLLLFRPAFSFCACSPPAIQPTTLTVLEQG